MNFKHILSTCILSIAISNGTSAQYNTPAVGKWSAYLPYGTVNSLAYGDNKIFATSTSTFFIYDITNGQTIPYSKANGMHDVNMLGCDYDSKTGAAILLYTNGNIDIFKDNEFSNVPDITQTSTAITIYNLAASNGYGLVSSSQGLILVDMDKAEIKSTIPFYDSTTILNVADAQGDGTNLYVATSAGAFKTTFSNNFIQNYSSWTKLSNTSFSHIGIYNQKGYYATGDSVFIENNGALQFLYKGAQDIVNINPGDGGIWISVGLGSSTYSYAVKLSETGTVLDSVAEDDIVEIADPSDGTLWCGDNSRGIRKYNSSDKSWTSSFPDGPATESVYDVYAKDKNIWVAHGGVNTTSWAGLNNAFDFSSFLNGMWNNNYRYKVANLGYDYKLQNVYRITQDPYSQNIYAAAFNGGLLEYNPNNDSLKLYREGYLNINIANDSASYGLTSIAPDGNGNIYMTQYYTNSPFKVKTASGAWYTLNTPNITSGTELMIDDYGYKWFAVPTSAGGLVVYNDNNTPDNSSDDTYRRLYTGSSYGNLPSSDVKSIVNDNNGNIWVGTTNGIGIISCGSDILNASSGCGAVQPVVNYFQNGYLFMDQTITCMAVDGANRKWVGTSSGAWLVSDDGAELVNHFTAANSALLSDNILHIDIDPTIGTVYFSTDKGLCAYGGTATQGSTTMAKSEDLFVYPNPVPAGYSGEISIRGFSTNADVRITDAAGQLVYKTTANGGQVSWSGNDYTGHKVQSGVYLVFAVSTDGQSKKTGKFVIYK